MKNLLLPTILFIAQMANSQTPGISATIIALEKAALERWNNGDPAGYTDISAEDVTYFDPFVERRIDGLTALEKYYEPIRGQVHVTRYNMINPIVTAVEGMAVLTFNLESFEGEKVTKWNCTEVYRRSSEGLWKIVQTHWSLVKK